MQTNCPECGHSVSTWTTWCPGCSRRLRIHPLVKFFFWMIVLGAFLGWETETGTNSSGTTETLSSKLVVPFYGPLPVLQEEPSEEEQTKYEQIAVKRSFGYGLYQQEPVVRR